jgi:hypothetical protein
MVYDADVTCPYCFESFSVQVDPSEGDHQSWVWDCEVCCRPIDVSVSWDEDADTYLTNAERAQ